MPTTETPELGSVLLERARHAIAQALGLASPPPPDSPALDKRGATFVTLTMDGELRGCIGSLRPQRSLREDVARNAVAAALRDPRFPPLSVEEFPRIRVEVSRLGETHFLEFRDEEDALRQLRPKQDGVILFRGCREVSTFLPQVWEQLPEPHAFMAALKRKGGLPSDYWGSDLMLATYPVEKWKEAVP